MPDIKLHQVFGLWDGLRSRAYHTPKIIQKTPLIGSNNDGSSIISKVCLLTIPFAIPLTTNSGQLYHMQRVYYPHLLVNAMWKTMLLKTKSSIAVHIFVCSPHSEKMKTSTSWFPNGEDSMRILMERWSYNIQ